MFGARCVANEFIRRANGEGQPLTHLQIQKLVYFSHARLLFLHGQPLIDKGFEAWEYGPVVPDLYHALKRYGPDEVLEEIPIGDPPAYSSRETDIFDWCFNRYGHLSGPQLTRITHASGSPWSRAVTRDETLISNADIADYHTLEWRSDSLAELKRIHNTPAFQRLVLDSLEQDDSSGSYTLEDLKR